MFKGCLVALVTPFRDERVDYAALESLVEQTIAGGVNGLVVCGTTGESPTVSDEEHAEIIRAAKRKARGRVPVVAGTGTNCTESTAALSQSAVRAGADAIMLVSPYYNRPSQRGLYEHFNFVAQSVRVPIMLYNIPGRTGVEISPETIARLHEDHPHIAAVKHAIGSVEGAADVLAACNIALLSGDDTLTLPLIAVGAVGVVSVVANLLPKETSAMTDAALAGDWPTARAQFKRLRPLAKALMTLDTNPIPVKTALAIRGMMAEEFRLPMCRMETAPRQRLERLLAEDRANYPTRQPA